MPKGPGQLIKLHLKINDFKCLCCAPTNNKLLDDGT